MKKILFIFHKIGYGGANKMVVFVANVLAKNGFKVSIYTYEGNEEPNYKLDDNIEIIREMRYFKRSSKNKVFQLIRVIKLIKNIKPDLVISFMSTSNFFAVIGSKIFRIPSVVSERGNPQAENGVFSRFKQFFMNFSEGAVFQTKGAQKFFWKRLQNRSAIIENPVIGIDKKIEEWDKRQDKIAFVARFDIRQKRQDIMILGFSEVIKKYPNYKLHFYGDGEDEKIIKSMVRDKKMEENVVFEGKKDKIIDEIANAKLFALTSDFEGIPNSLIEAMSIGLPCVSTDCDPGGARVLIDNEENGMLIEKGDYKALANTIIRLIENKNLAEKIGMSAQSISERFNEDRIGKLWIDYIQQIIEKSGR